MGAGRRSEKENLEENDVVSDVDLVWLLGFEPRSPRPNSYH